jgi:predicted metalloprotease
MISPKSHVVRVVAALVVLAAAIPLSDGLPHTAAAQGGSRTFPETGKTVRGKFLTYWDTHGGLAQQGYPISNELQEKSDTDGKVYVVQYFERAVFELHPELQAPNDVLLSLLGVFIYNATYGGNAPGQVPNASAGSVLYPQTGHRVGGKFLQYWRTNGGLPQQGYPISDEFTEVSALDGKAYTVQYFERAVFELHPEKAGTPFEVLLSQLGTFRYKSRYGSSQGDADGDTIADAEDRCPGDPENKNGVYDTDGCPDTINNLIDDVANDLNTYWDDVLSNSGYDYAGPQRFRAYTEPIRTACGPAELNNAFYCGGDHSIYYDISFLEVQLKTFGDMAPVIVIAHEWGHLVQANLGLLGGQFLSIQTELQADCLAGAWTLHTDEEGFLESGDIEEGATALFNAGDVDLPWFDPQAHGSPDQRVDNFFQGYDKGPAVCFGE